VKIEIDEHGFLWIERAGTMRDCACARKSRMPCGDWCPLFGEPPNDWEHGDGINALTICEGRTLFGKTEDKRPRPASAG
jgi:hypothetical protein